MPFKANSQLLDWAKLPSSKLHIYQCCFASEVQSLRRSSSEKVLSVALAESCGDLTLLWKTSQNLVTQCKQSFQLVFRLVGTKGRIWPRGVLSYKLQTWRSIRLLPHRTKLGPQHHLWQNQNGEQPRPPASMSWRIWGRAITWYGRYAIQYIGKGTEIIRAHDPFVAEEEIEKVINYLRTLILLNRMKMIQMR